MDKSFALVKDGKVFNVISATQEFIDSIPASKLQGADEVVDLTGTEFGIGCLYDTQSKTLSRPAPSDPKQPEPTLEEKVAALTAKIAQLESDVTTMKEPVK